MLLSTLFHVGNAVSCRVKNKNLFKLPGIFTFFLINAYCTSVKADFNTRKRDSIRMMRAAQFEPGSPDKLHIGEVPIPKLRDGEILIKVYATAINRADTLQRKGLYPPPTGESSILGLEAAGVVHGLSSVCSNRWRQGDRVMALLPGGGNAEYVAVHENHAIPVPDWMNFTDAAAIPEVWLTAYQLLHKVGGIQAGERVLIHAGASGVGTAATQLVRLAGAVPYVTAGSREKIELAKSMGAEEGFNYKEGQFSQSVMQATNGQGVHMVLDCVGASMWQQNTDVLSTDGRWVLYGLMGGNKVDGDILSRLLRKRISVLATTLRARSKEYKSELVKSFSENALPHFQTKKLHPVVDRVLSLDDIASAHQTMEDNKNKGKIVLTVHQDDKSHEEL